MPYKPMHASDNLCIHHLTKVCIRHVMPTLNCNALCEVNNNNVNIQCCRCLFFQKYNEDFLVLGIHHQFGQRHLDSL